MRKNIELVVAPRDPYYVWNGFRVHNFIPSFPLLNMKRMDPFLLLDYNSKYFFTASKVPRWVWLHPHRGFETVSIAYKGRIEHRDNHWWWWVISEGEVQWMTAWSWILHEEFHELEWSKKWWDFHMIQLWVNLPKKYKMTKPWYQAISRDKIEIYNLENNSWAVEIISWEYKNIKWPAKTFSPINLMNVKLNNWAKADFSFDKDFTTAVLVVQWKVRVNSEEIVSSDYFILFWNDWENFEFEALDDDTIIFLMSWKPLNEPIYASGPFVMNTQEEVSQAYRDFHNWNF